MPIRVLFAEDNYLVREGIVRLLELEQELEVVGTCGDLPSLLASVEELQPDVVLTDIRMPPTHTDEGIAAAAQLRETHPGVGVVVLSQYDEPEYALALLEKGSEGRAYLLKERVSETADIVSAIRQVHQGGSVIDPKVVEGLVTSRARQEDPLLALLTAREREVLSEMAQGKTNAAIAEALFLTERAIEKHSNAIFSKLGLSGEKDVHRRVKAVLLFLSHEVGTRADSGGGPPAL